MDGGDEFVFEPGIVLEDFGDFFVVAAFGGGDGLEGVGVLGGGVVAPDGDVVDVLSGNDREGL